ncbi:MAG: hypothetical protein QOJ64_2508 [Acidobacteriota bacterium]|nr:hypothetical protein [Acidobacteriota bacterium]
MADGRTSDSLALILTTELRHPRCQMDDKTLIVVSAENNPYMAWQCKLFHFSCTTRADRTPLIIAHDTETELHPDFEEILKVGGQVRIAPNYKQTARGDIYPPRNTPATLLHAVDLCQEQIQSIVLCDPDMIFVRAPQFPSTLSGDYCSYMNYDLECVDEARAVLRISPGSIAEAGESLRCGVPYSVPTKVARRLGNAWIEAIDAFPPRKWEDVMYAFGLAAIRLGLEVTLTRVAEHNYWPQAMAKADVIHYCYGDEAWNKRQYFREDQARGVWESPGEAQPGTILSEIFSQIREAREFYSSF